MLFSKNHTPFFRASGFLAWSFCFFSAFPLFAEVKCHSVPKEFCSGYWEVKANGQENGVCSARTCDPPFAERYDFGGEYAFTSFEMDEPVALTVRSKVARDLNNVRIRPASADVKVKKIDDSTLEIMLSKPVKFSLEPNGREHVLLVFANAPEENTPDLNDPAVKVIPPGVTHPKNGLVSLKDGETLYLSPGAVLQAGIKAIGENIRICGHGVLDSSPWEWRKGPTGHVLELFKCRNLIVEDIVIRGASHWTVVPTACDGVEIRNVKICGGRVQNDDGINPCNSRNVHISDCFIRTDDDCIALKGLNSEYGNCENITVENCILWCDRARISLLGHESRAEFMRNVRYENLDVIHFQMPVFLLEPGEDMRMENIQVKNVRVECDYADRVNPVLVVRPTINQYMRKQVPGHIANCSFSDISIDGTRAKCLFIFEGRDAEHLTKNVELKDIQVFGQPLSTENGLKIGDFTENVTVAPRD